MQPDKVRIVKSLPPLMVCLPWHSVHFHPPAHFSRTKEESDFLPATFFTSHLWTRANVVIAPAQKKVTKHSEEKCDSGKPRLTCARIERQTIPSTAYFLLAQQSFSQVHSEDQTLFFNSKGFHIEISHFPQQFTFSLPATLTSHIITD